MSDSREQSSIEQASTLAPRLVYEVIRQDGEEELQRPLKSLIWSGTAAGVMISFSLLGEAILRTYLPETPSRYLLENLGYSLGFLLVILGRMQLFTENTITTVLPVMNKPKPAMFALLLRLWAVVLSANVVGALVAGMVIAKTPVVPPELHPAMLELSQHALGFPPGEAFARAIPAGVLIAAIVWMLPQVKESAFWLILTFTWLIAAGDFTHVVAGSVEMWLLLLTSNLSAYDAVFDFFLPVLLGNIVGGTAIFTLMAWGQVKEEVSDSV